MNYLRHYYKLVNNAFLSNRQKCEEFEGHHVKPYSLGGKRIVLLTAKEHYIAHYLLYKHFDKYGNKNQKIKMARAFNAMTFSSTGNIQRYTSRSFAIARKAFRESIQGINHPFYGKTHSDETRKKISKKLMCNFEWREKSPKNMKQVRANVTEEQENTRIQNVKAALRGHTFNVGRIHADESKENMSIAALGKKKSDKHKENISKGWEKREIKICPHCNKESKNASSMIRWHFDNCKFKPIDDIISII